MIHRLSFRLYRLRYRGNGVCYRRVNKLSAPVRDKVAQGEPIQARQNLSSHDTAPAKRCHRRSSTHKVTKTLGGASRGPVHRVPGAHRADRVYHGPTPTVGSTVDCRLRLRIGGDALVADAQLHQGGRPVVSITGWRDVLFDGGEAVTRVHRWAGHNTLAERHGDGWRIRADALSGHAVRELCMRKYLGAAERGEYAARSPTLADRADPGQGRRAGRRWDLGGPAVSGRGNRSDHIGHPHVDK